MNVRQLGKLLLPAALLVGTSATVLLSAEIYMRLTRTEAQADGRYWGRGAFAEHPTAGYIHAPEFRVRLERAGNFSVDVAIGPDGLRQLDVADQASFPARVLVLGDSYTFGLGVEQHETFSAELGRRLNPSGVGVINGGQTGYSVRQELALGRELIPRLRPDLVTLFMFVDNDIDPDYYAAHENIAVRYGYRLRRDRWLPFAPFDWLRTHSYFLMFVNTRVERVLHRRRRGHFHREARERPAEVAAPTLTAVAELAELSAEHGGRLFVVMLPRRRYFDEVLQAGLAEAGIAYRTLEESDFERSHYFPTDGHWNAAGHLRTAQVVEPWIIEQLSREPRDEPDSR